MITSIPQAQIRFGECLTCGALNNPEAPSNSIKEGYIWPFDMHCEACSGMTKARVKHMPRQVVTDTDWVFLTSTRGKVRHWQGGAAHARPAYFIKPKSKPDQWMIQQKEVAEIMQHVVDNGQERTVTFFDTAGTSYFFGGMTGKTTAVLLDVTGKPIRQNIMKLDVRDIEKIVVQNFAMTMCEILTPASLYLKALK